MNKFFHIEVEHFSHNTFHRNLQNKVLKVLPLVKTVVSTKVLSKEDISMDEGCLVKWRREATELDMSITEENLKHMAKIVKRKTRKRRHHSSSDSDDEPATSSGRK